MAADINGVEEIGIDSLFSIKGKTALVTGGARGIGLMIARGYVEAGAKVYIASRKQDVCKEVAKALSEHGECIGLGADLSTPEGCIALAKEIADREDTLDILVNNSGITWGAPFESFPDDAFAKVMNMNVNSIFTLTRELAPLLKKAATPEDPARIINIGSMDGIKAPSVLGVGLFPYAASKAGLHHLTRALAIELGPKHITVNVIAPGFFPSKMTKWAIETHQQDMERNAPLGRIGHSSDMAGIAIYLASRAGAYTTGTVIPVDGGTNIK